MPQRRLPSPVARMSKSTANQFGPVGGQVGPARSKSLSDLKWPELPRCKDSNNHSRELSRDKRRNARRSDSRKCIRERAGNGYRGIGERCRRREPISRRDVKTNRIRDGGRCARETAEYRQQQAEGGNGFGKPLAWPGADGRRYLQQRQIEHQVRNPCACDGCDHLNSDIERRDVPWKLTAPTRKRGSQRD